MWVKLQVFAPPSTFEEGSSDTGPTITSRLVSAIVTSRLEYYNALLAGLSQSTIAQLQRIQNAVARLVGNLRFRDKVGASLRELYWHPIRYRIIYKLQAVLDDAQCSHRSQPALRQRDANSDSAYAKS